MYKEADLISKKSKRKTSDDVLAVAIVIALAIAIISIVVFAVGFLLQWLWNNLIPMIFNLPEITYWQAVGLFILAQLFLGDGIKIETEGKTNHKKIRKDQKRPEVMVGQLDEQDYRVWWNKEGKRAFEEYRTIDDGPNTDDFND